MSQSPPADQSNKPRSREDVDRLIAGGDSDAAAAALQEIWCASPASSTAGFVNSRFEALRQRIPLTPCRVFILRSFTVEPIIPLLRALAFTGGIDLEVQIGDFNSYTQEILNPQSALYQSHPTAAILAVQTMDVAPDLWERFAELDPAAVEDAIKRVGAEFEQLILKFRLHGTAHLIIHSLQRPPAPALGILDARLQAGQAAAIDRINLHLAEVVRQQTDVHLLDYGRLVARRGSENWFDARKWISARMPIAATELIHLAREWMRFLHPITGRICKVVAVDLDNTLWGGVIGEDGMSGIHLNDAYPGAAFRNLQRALLDLHHRGILLALCSKNNPAEAMDAIEKHPGMLLRPEHFAAMRINWNDKAANLREIAAELNIGIDSIAFVDDNPAERAFVRSQAPQVTVIDLPADPMEYAATIRQAPVFERLNLSAEDRARGKMYAQQRLRSDSQSTSGSLEDFLRSLEMRVEIAPVNPQSLGRASQLTQKTNQFNLTTRRYAEQEFARLLDRPEWRAYTAAVVDRFGDNGIVGVAMTRDEGDTCEIDNFLLSCRVIGRTVETAMLSVIADDARRRGRTRLLGRFLPTKKNAPAKEFFASHQFTTVAEDAAGSTFSLDLQTTTPCPPWIDLHVRRD